MTWTVDSRIPVRLASLGEAVDGDALLLEEGVVASPGLPAARFAPAGTAHAPHCACCAGRSPAALALDRLFLARARGEMPFFRRVLAVTETAAAQSELLAAIGQDRLAYARFRMGE